MSLAERQNGASVSRNRSIVVETVFKLSNNPWHCGSAAKGCVGLLSRSGGKHLTPLSRRRVTVAETSNRTSFKKESISKLSHTVMKASV